MLSFSAGDAPNTQARQLARHYPTGRVWSNTFNQNSNIGKLVFSLAQEWLRSEEFAAISSDELYILKTEGLLERWEESVGIPNAYFDQNVSLEQRRLQVLQLLIDFGGAQTLQDFYDIGVLFGFPDVSVRFGALALFPLAFPITAFSGDSKSARNTLFVSLPASEFVFPLAFPLQFSASSGIVLEGIYRALLPATTQLIFFFGT